MHLQRKRRPRGANGLKSEERVGSTKTYYLNVAGGYYAEVKVIRAEEDLTREAKKEGRRVSIYREKNLNKKRLKYLE